MLTPGIIALLLVKLQLEPWTISSLQISAHGPGLVKGKLTDGCCRPQKRAELDLYLTSRVSTIRDTVYGSGKKGILPDKPVIVRSIKRRLVHELIQALLHGLGIILEVSISIGVQTLGCGSKS